MKNLQVILLFKGSQHESHFVQLLEIREFANIVAGLTLQFF